MARSAHPARSLRECSSLSYTSAHLSHFVHCTVCFGPVRGVCCWSDLMIYARNTCQMQPPEILVVVHRHKPGCVLLQSVTALLHVWHHNASVGWIVCLAAMLNCECPGGCMYLRRTSGCSCGRRLLMTRWARHMSDTSVPRSYNAPATSRHATNCRVGTLGVLLSKRDCSIHRLAKWIHVAACSAASTANETAIPSGGCMPCREKES